MKDFKRTELSETYKCMVIYIIQNLREEQLILLGDKGFLLPPKLPLLATNISVDT